MPNLEVEVQLENHSHLTVIDVESVLEAEHLKGKEIVCSVCGKKGVITKVGIPGRKQRSAEEKPTSSSQQSMFKE
jgi:hypothetical protein